MVGSRSVKNKLRHASALIVGAFMLTTVVGFLLDRREAEIGAQLRDDLVPRLEFGPRLKLGYRALTRSFQDASAAHDEDLLAETVLARDALTALIAANTSLLTKEELLALRTAIDEYDKAARDVAASLLADDMGEASVERMESMRVRQQRLGDLVDKHTGIDRKQVARAFDNAERARAVGMGLRLAATGACMMLAVVILAWLSRDLVSRLHLLVTGLERFGEGKLETPIPVVGQDEIAAVGKQANDMANNLAQLIARHERNDWLTSGQNRIGQELRGELSQEEAALRVLRSLCRYTGAVAGTFYYRGEEEGDLILLAAHGIAAGKQAPNTFAPGQGIVGSAFADREQVWLKDLPAGYFNIVSGLGASQARQLLVTPLVRHDTPFGVVELGFMQPPHPLSAELLGALLEEIIISVEVANARARVDALLVETREQASRLAAQEEELRVHNEQLQAQQEELRVTNEELEDQRGLLGQRNKELTEAHASLEQKAQELMAVSGYKSRFLAHMSHELRTPLNSMLLLSGILVEDERDNLSSKQLEYCETIRAAGESLLGLINDLLDLAKIESGRVELSIGPVRLSSLCAHVNAVCSPIAANMGTAFRVVIEPGTPELIEADERRLGQVLVNLAGNAAKFTRDGVVSLLVQPHDDGKQVKFAVVDNGPGIAAEDLERVFLAFDQGSQARAGGTGLGLAIANELVTQMGGTLEVESEVGKGSTFFFSLPIGPAPRAAVDAVAPGPIEPERPYILVIDDDPAVCQAVQHRATEMGFDVVGLAEGTTGYRQACAHPPAGIVLDLMLPDTHGFDVLERLRSDPRTASIPVHVVSAVQADSAQPTDGLVGYAQKPLGPSDLAQVIQRLRDASPHQRVVLLEPNQLVGDAVETALAAEGWSVTRFATVDDAVREVEEGRSRAVVVGLGPDFDGTLDALRRMRPDGDGAGPDAPHVVVYCDSTLPTELVHVVRRFASLVLTKQGRYAERLREELKLFFMHLDDKRGRTHGLDAREPRSSIRLEGTSILIVDDDMRTVYALTALLQGRGAAVLTAVNGRRALDVLDREPMVDCVLMDLMMPEMDGYEALRRIRSQKRFRDLPVIVLTASATPEDRERCLQAGATEYLTKPVDYNVFLELVQQHTQARDSHA